MLLCNTSSGSFALARFCHRIVVLLDSKVVIGAVCKGRSSSIPLNRILRQLASLCFAGGLVLHCIFIPATHNPADWPSRGGPGTWPAALRRPRGIEWQLNKLLRQEVEELQQERAQLEAMLA